MKDNIHFINAEQYFTDQRLPYVWLPPDADTSSHDCLMATALKEEKIYICTQDKRFPRWARELIVRFIKMILKQGGRLDG